jgi:hypothetical protein
MGRKAKVLLLLALLAVAAVIWVPQFGIRLSSSDSLTRYPLGPRYYCESCGFHFAAAPGRLAPLKCPKCGRGTAMRTMFGPGATGGEFIGCKKCGTVVPSQLWKWSAEDKARWEKRLSQLGEGQFLSSAEVKDMNQGKLARTSALDWMPWDDFQRLPAAESSGVRCPKCGNTDPGQFDYSVATPDARAEAAGRTR